MRPISMRHLVSLGLVALFVGLVACGDDDAAPAGSTGGACNTLCTDSKFASGTESKFAQRVTECQCTGTGGNVEKPRCEAYCAPYGIPADKAALSGTDKCVCDGTSL